MPFFEKLSLIEREEHFQWVSIKVNLWNEIKKNFCIVIIL